MFEFVRKWFGGERAEKVPQQTASVRQQQKETDLRQSEEEFAKLVAGVRDYAVFIMDRQGHILTWNAGAEQIKGYHPEQIIGQHFSRFYPNEAVSTGWPDHELAVAASTGRFEDEGWRVRQDGGRFWASVVITALRDNSGEVRGFLKITRDLTDRKQAEEKLRLSEERFRLMVEGVMDHAIFMLDPQGRIVTWNTGAERLKGYKAGEIIGQHFSRFYPPEVVARGWPEEELRRAIADGRIEDEGWRIRKDGSRFWANVVITALRNESGVLQGFAKVTRDLTERRQAEENARQLLQEEAARKAAEASAQEIERQREQLQVTLASIGDAVIVTDREGRVSFLNPVAAGLTGWGLEMAVDQPLDQVFRIVNEQTLQPVENPVSQVFRENRIVELANHTALIARDGELVPIEDTAAPIRNRTHEIIGAVLVFRDVTEARRATEARRYLAAIVASSDDAIIGQTLDGRIASWNKGAERLYGYRSGEMIGQPSSLLTLPDQPGEPVRIMQGILQEGTIQTYETQQLHKEGRRVDVSLTVSPVVDDLGEVIGVSTIARDISARKEEDRRKTEFLATLSHELRNPLAPIRMGLDVIGMAGEDREMFEEARGMMVWHLEQLVRLTDDLLDIARITQGKLRLRREQLHLQEVIRRSVESAQPLIEQSRHQITVALPPDPILLDADPVRLTQIFANLLNNAAKYTEEGGQIWLTASQENGEVAVTVRDTGIGISPEQLPKLFEMFAQAAPALERSQGGLGIGLALVDRLVKMHEGRIEARSEGLGQGSEFTVRLPVMSISSSPEAATRAAENKATAQRLRILIVDDNRAAARITVLALRPQGYEVHVAHDGQAAVEKAAELHPDVILLDIGMPVLNGYQACRAIRELPGGNNITMIALTGWGQAEDQQKALEAGFDYHCTKPVDLKELYPLLVRKTPAE